MLLRKTGREVHGINHRGLIVALPEVVAEAAGDLAVDCLIDGEAVGDILHAFDLLEVSGIDVRQRSCLDRYRGLTRVLNGNGPIRAVYTAILPEEKQRAFEELRAGGAEGIVLKDANSHYTAGSPAPGRTQLKLKFVTTASFIVGAINKRRSVALVLINRNDAWPLAMSASLRITTFRNQVRSWK